MSIRDGAIKRAEDVFCKGDLFGVRWGEGGVCWGWGVAFEFGFNHHSSQISMRWSVKGSDARLQWQSLSSLGVSARQHLAVGRSCQVRHFP